VRPSALHADSGEFDSHRRYQFQLATICTAAKRSSNASELESVREILAFLLLRLMVGPRVLGAQILVRIQEEHPSLEVSRLRVKLDLRTTTGKPWAYLWRRQKRLMRRLVVPEIVGSLPTRHPT